MDDKSWPALSLKEAHARLTAPGAAFELVEQQVRGIALRIWKHAPATAGEAFGRARVFSAREFLVYQDERVTYEAFARASLKLAQLLVARGIKKGDRVALVMANLPEWPVVFMAALLAGAIVVPLNARWTATELGYAILDCGARLIFADAQRLGCLKDLPAAVDQVVVTRAGNAAALPSGVSVLEELIGTPAAWHRLPDVLMPDVGLAPEDDATIFYTSGTTGAPKGALGTHRSLTTNIFAMPFATARNALRAGRCARASEGTKDPLLAVQEQRITLVAVPFFHVIGSLSLLLPSMAAGGKLVLMPKFDAAQACALIEREHVSVTGGVPAVALSLLEHARDYGLSSLKLVTFGGAPSPWALPARIRAELGAMPGQGWGMTETSATCTTHSGMDYLKRPQSCGPALPVSRLKVMDGPRELPPGKVGELWAFGPNIVKGYWNRPEATAERFCDGWLRTGDLAMLDEEGFCTIVDRTQDMLIRGGENIYCVEVENVLTQHPAIMDAALVGLPHPLLGQVPAALVQARLGTLVTQAELQDFARSRLAAFKVPVKVAVLHRPLPRNDAGKLMKRGLHKAFQA